MSSDLEMLGWIADVSTWAPATPQWERALELLDDEEKRQVQRFLFAKDQRLALASRLLQRQLIGSVFNVPIRDIRIARTPEGKPFWQRAQTSDATDRWNYNVSHHGTIVAIAAHPHALVGVDVMQLSERPRRRESGSMSDDFFRAFTDYFTTNEWNYIRCSEDENGQFHRFYQLWSLKESYIKAVGIGLGFTLLRAEFFCEDDTCVKWMMRLDGQVATRWRFLSHQVQGSNNQEPHVVSVALGPVEDMWNPTHSSIFPGPILPSNYTEPYEVPEDFQWKEKTIEDLALHT